VQDITDIGSTLLLFTHIGSCVPSIGTEIEDLKLVRGLGDRARPLIMHSVAQDMCLSK